MVELNQVIHKLNLNNDNRDVSSYFNIDVGENSLSVPRIGRFITVDPQLFDIKNSQSSLGNEKEISIHSNKIYTGYSYQNKSAFFSNKRTIIRFLTTVLEKNLYIYVHMAPSASSYKRCLIIEKPKTLKGKPKLRFSKDGVVLGMKNFIPVEFSFLPQEEIEDLKKTALILKEMLGSDTTR